MGERIIREYAVFNHNPYDNCAEVGFTPNGIRVSLNREFLSCDLKIAIGGVVPHPLNGFGGGGKIIMPGIASAETINGTHATKVKKLHVRREKILLPEAATCRTIPSVPKWRRAAACPD